MASNHTLSCHGKGWRVVAWYSNVSAARTHREETSERHVGLRYLLSSDVLMADGRDGTLRFESKTA